MSKQELYFNSLVPTEYNGFIKNKEWTILTSVLDLARDVILWGLK